MPSHGPSEATSPVTFTKQSDLVSHASNTLQPVLKLPSSGNQSSRASSSCGGIDSTCFQGSEFLPFVQRQMTSDDAILDRRCLSSAEGIPTSAVRCILLDFGLYLFSLYSASVPASLVAQGFYAPCSHPQVSKHLTLLSESLPPDPSEQSPSLGMSRGNRNKCPVPGILYNTDTLESLHCVRCQLLAL